MNNKTRTAWTFLSPMLIVLVLVAAWPLGRTIWFSFTDANINNMDAARFVGLENYFAYAVYHATILRLGLQDLAALFIEPVG